MNLQPRIWRGGQSQPIERIFKFHPLLDSDRLFEYISAVSGLAYPIQVNIILQIVWEVRTCFALILDGIGDGEDACRWADGMGMHV